MLMNHPIAGANNSNKLINVFNNVRCTQFVSVSYRDTIIPCRCVCGSLLASRYAVPGELSIIVRCTSVGG